MTSNSMGMSRMVDFIDIWDIVTLRFITPCKEVCLNWQNFIGYRYRMANVLVLLYNVIKNDYVTKLRTDCNRMIKDKYLIEKKKLLFITKICIFKWK